MNDVKIARTLLWAFMAVAYACVAITVVARRPEIAAAGVTALLIYVLVVTAGWRS